MAPAQVAIPIAAPAINLPPPQSASGGALEDDSTIKTVDGLVRHRARSDPHATIVSYPSSGIEYVDYSMQQLDVFAYRVARHYQTWIPTRVSSAAKPTTVAILGPSNFDYAVTMLALTKLGHTVLFLSTRISNVAVESLMQATGATYLLADSRFQKLAEDVQATMAEIKIGEIARESVYNFPIEVHADTRMDYQLDLEVETLNNVYIIHSSGSTGLPKPIYQPHKSAIANYAFSMDMKAFITLPLYHNHGICNFFRAIYSKKSIHLYNADLPLTRPYLTNILRKHEFEIFYGVPYALKLLAESEEGIQLLKQLKIVMYGGSACPDTLGDLLVEKGVNLVGHYGATEVGQLMTSFRPVGDKAWNYVRESPKLSPYLKWVPRGPKLFECTVLSGWPSKVASNQPDGSYATKDLFEPHPTIEQAWKYIARLDDTIVLVNGEKFNPVVMEGKVRSHKAVTETIVFGAGRPYLGLLVIPSEAVQGKDETAIIDEIWPTVEEANQTVEAYARLSRDMIKVLPHDCQFPRTDKGSIIRQAFYKQFAKEIEGTYDQVASAGGEGKVLSLPELEIFVREVVAKTLPEAKDIDTNADFFSLGLDSLQSIQVRTEFLKTIDISGKTLGSNVVFEYPSIASLSSYLYRLRTGEEEEAESVENKMQKLIEKYSGFPSYESTSQDQELSVAVTGATGSLGAHVVTQLSARPNISTIYCLVRASNNGDAARRVRKSLIQRKVYHTLSLAARRKIVALPCDLSNPRLGLSDEMYAAVAQNLKSVIHCAWSVNFNLGLSSFENDSIAGVRHLLDLCLASSPDEPASFDFCSSVSTVARCPTTHTPESLPDLTWAQGMGYAQSKMVSEHVCMNAAKKTGVKARVLRVGQIVADTNNGVWNATEAIPLMIQSALTFGALPKLQETPSWTPVDIIAKAVSEIALSDAGSIVANVTNAKTFHWTNDLLPALRSAGLEFEEVEPKEWVNRLRASNPDPTLNPPIKLVDFFASKYDKDTFAPSRTYETSTARSFSPSLDAAPVLDTEFVNKFVTQFKATAWKRAFANAELKKKQVIVVAGPCGSGKTTVAKQLSKKYVAPYIEGDELHTFEAVSRMANGTALEDSDRVAWLERLKRRSLETLHELGYDKVFVSCSALKQEYRNALRAVEVDNDVKVLFLDLQVGEEELVRRMGNREGHYMSPVMVDSQLAIYEAPGAGEFDVLPVDAERSVTEVFEDVVELLDDLQL